MTIAPGQPALAEDVNAALAAAAAGFSVKSFGAIMDGQSHPLSSKYGTLAAAQAVYPFATSLTDEIDWCGIQAMVNALYTDIIFPEGTAIINHPIVSSTVPVTVLGGGVNSTKIIQTLAGADGWQHMSPQGFQMFGVTLACNGVGGTAITANFANTGNSTFTLRDVYIVGNINNTGGQLSNYWHDGIWAYNPSVTQFDHIWLLGSNGGYLGNMGDAIYFKCRVGPPSGSFDIGMRDSRIASYQRGMVLDSINDATGQPTAVNLQGIMLERVNYAALMQFVTVIGSCLELVLSHCQGAGFGSVIHADGAATVTVRDGLYFLNNPGSQAIMSQLPQDMFWISHGSNWWVKDNELLIASSAVGAYVFNIMSSATSGGLSVGASQRIVIRDNLVYIAQSGTPGVLAGFVNIDALSSGVIESGTTFSGWNGWPLWTNPVADTDSAAGGNVAEFQALVARGVPTRDQWAGQGTTIGWNYGGSGGHSAFINTRASAPGGFQWYSIPSPNLITDTPTLLGTLDAAGSLTLPGNITADGNVLLTGDGTIGLTCTFNTTVPATRGMVIQTGGLNRWIIEANNTAEGGSNAGSDLLIGRYTDAGTANGSPVAINRATGLVTLSSMEVTGQSTFIGAQVAGLFVRTGTSYSVGANDYGIIFNPGGTYTLTLPDATTNPGRILFLRLIANFAVNSASSNVVPLAGGAAGTGIMPATAGKFCQLQSDGTTWQIMQAN